MCGIVLAGASSVMGQKDIAVFEKLLYCDTFRGDHSTGVMSGYHNLGEYSVDVNKAAVDGPTFLKSATWESAKSKMMTTVAPTGVSYLTKKTPYFFVGHNRYATMGAKTATNAHPFQVGNVTLVHNGTLINQDLLPDADRFEVDSHNIAHAINKEGIAETIKKLHGAFTLIWHDMRDNTVNILRNEDRPFHLAKTNSDDWFGASEEEMLLWILNRDNKAGKAKVSPVKEHFECEVGVQYIFDVSGGKFVFKEEVKHELPKFSYTYPTRYATNYNYNYNSGYDWTSYYATTAKELLAPYGVNVGDTIKFVAYNYKKYQSSNGLGTVEGFIEDTQEYIDVVCHAISESEYQKHCDYQGIISNAYMQRGILTIVVRSVQKFVQAEEVVVTPPDEETITTDDGVAFKRVDWEQSVASTCRACLTQIPYDEADIAVSVGNSGYICWKCESEMKKDLQDTGFAMLPSLPAPTTFTCEGCKEDVALSDESDFLHGHCEKCAESYYNHKKTKELDNGIFVTKDEWDSYKTCNYCKNEIPWEEAEKSTMVGDSAICINCISNLY